MSKGDPQKPSAADFAQRLERAVNRLAGIKDDVRAVRFELADLRASCKLLSAEDAAFVDRHLDSAVERFTLAIATFGTRMVPPEEELGF